MSDDLHIPVDFERTHEFRLLVQALKTRAGKSVEDKSVEASAVFIFMRLFVDLAFLARSTNRPGYLTRTGKLLFESSLEPLFAEDSQPTDLLKEALLLELPQSTAVEDGELFCPLFAQLNPHFAGNYVSKEKRGNVASLYERQKRQVAQEAQHQALLLPPETFRKRDGGELMTEPEINRAMALIRTIDNALGSPRRSTQQYNEALIADAFDISSKYAREPDVIKEVYMWILNNRAHPALAKTTEQILKDFENVERMSRR